MRGGKNKQAGKNSKILNEVLGLSLRVHPIINIPEIMQIHVDGASSHTLVGRVKTVDVVTLGGHELLQQATRAGVDRLCGWQWRGAMAPSSGVADVALFGGSCACVGMLSA